jgi:hypothetical protein
MDIKTGQSESMLWLFSLLSIVKCWVSTFKFKPIEMNDGTIVDILVFKLLPCCECCIHSLG